MRALARTVRRAALAAALLLLLAGCISERQEQQLGDRIAAQVNAQVPLVQDPSVTAYVSRLGRQIAMHSERPDLDYRFYVVDVDEVNAFAIPGGHVYVNRGLIERTRNQAELSSVLAHEIGHVAARHGVQKLQRELRTSTLMGIMYELILGREPAILEQEAIDMGGMLWHAQHSREDEAEADALAVEYMVSSGTDPRGMLTLLDTLLEEEQATPASSSPMQWFSTHPTTRDRLVEARRSIRDVLEEPSPDLSLDAPSYGRFLERVRSLPRGIRVIQIR